MKVMQLLPELNSGGVERGTLEIAKPRSQKDIRHWWCRMADGWLTNSKLKHPQKTCSQACGKSVLYAN